MVRGAASRHENTTGNGGKLGCICYVCICPTLKNLSSLNSERNTALTACLGSKNAARHNTHTPQRTPRPCQWAMVTPRGLHNLSLFFIAHNIPNSAGGCCCVKAVNGAREASERAAGSIPARPRRKSMDFYWLGYAIRRVWKHWIINMCN